MDCMDDPKFQLISITIDGTTKEILKCENGHWLNKCGHTFIRHAVTVNYNNHFYHKGCSWVGGRLDPDKIPVGKCGRVFVNMRHVLMAIKTKTDFIYTAVYDSLEPALTYMKTPPGIVEEALKDSVKPSFDVFIEY